MRGRAVEVLVVLAVGAFAALCFWAAPHVDLVTPNDERPSEVSIGLGGDFETTVVRGLLYSLGGMAALITPFLVGALLLRLIRDVETPTGETSSLPEARVHAVLRGGNR